MVEAMNKDPDWRPGPINGPPVVGGGHMTNGYDGWPEYLEDQVALTMKGISDYIFVERKRYSIELINNGLVGVNYRIALTGALRRGSFGTCKGGGGFDAPGSDGDPTQFFPLAARGKCVFTIELPIMPQSDLTYNAIKIYIEGRIEPVINHRITISSYKNI